MEARQLVDRHWSSVDRRPTKRILFLCFPKIKWSHKFKQRQKLNHFYTTFHPDNPLKVINIIWTCLKLTIILSPKNMLLGPVVMSLPTEQEVRIRFPICCEIFLKWRIGLGVSVRQCPLSILSYFVWKPPAFCWLQFKGEPTVLLVFLYGIYSKFPPLQGIAVSLETVEVKTKNKKKEK